MQDYLKKLNDRQLEAAVCTEGPLLIIAGAGSGKTSTMTARIAYMIQEKNISPYSILAVTFTNKAAREMKERVEQLGISTFGMWISTFHSACVRILRVEAPLLGYTSSFTVYDPVDQKTLVKSIIKDMELDEKLFTPSLVLSRISSAKEKKIDAEQFMDEVEKIHGRDYALQRGIAGVYLRYEASLKKFNAMDFDDLILNTVRLFDAHRDVLEKYQDRFRYIMVDEYQDTNMLQYSIVSSLAGSRKNICVVGDDDQCIYEWRGADIRNILEFEKDFPGAASVKLEQNYRSTGEILALANSLIAKNSSRKKKKLWTDLGAGEKPIYRNLNDDVEEARFTAGAIENAMAKDSGLRFGDFAVLYRTNAQSRRFEEYFAAKGIPYQVLSGLRFYDRKEIKDILSYLRLVTNPSDDISFARIINEPKRGIGPTAMSKIRAYAGVLGLSLFDAIKTEEVQISLTAKSRAEVSKFCDLMTDLSENSSKMTVDEIYDRVLDGSGYLDFLRENMTVENESRLENLLEFKSVIAEKQKDMQDGEVLTLDKFMETISLISDVDNKDDTGDAVVLMTLHSAKGLEFPVVFMPGLETGLFPGIRALDSDKVMQEERRLCYVGMTRAMRKLYLTSARERMIYGRYERSSVSIFLQEADSSHIQGDKVYSRPRTAVSDRYDTDNYQNVTSYTSPIAAAAAVRFAARQKAPVSPSADSFKAGDKVNHPKFGPGTVIELTSSVVTVVFDSVGTKKLALSIAPLTKI